MPREYSYAYSYNWVPKAKASTLSSRHRSLLSQLSLTHDIETNPGPLAVRADVARKITGALQALLEALGQESSSAPPNGQPRKVKQKATSKDRGAPRKKGGGWSAFNPPYGAPTAQGKDKGGKKPAQPRAASANQRAPSSKLKRTRGKGKRNEKPTIAIDAAQPLGGVLGFLDRHCFSMQAQLAFSNAPPDVQRVVCKEYHPSPAGNQSRRLINFIKSTEKKLDKVGQETNAPPQPSPSCLDCEDFTRFT